jgi:hypothetical protein
MNLTQCIRGGDAGGRPGYIIGFQYDPDTVETLKRSIPHFEREWREDSKAWWVSIKYEDVLKGLFGNFEALAHWQGSLF